MAESTGDGGEEVLQSTGEHEEMLSVVVITHDERERIDACLESVFEACEPLEDFEVVLVDSRSTDGTVDVASRHPITILQLPSEPVVTPSAGRYVGTAATDGDLVLFVDGDMILEDGWLEGACRRIRADPTLAGVDGHLDEPSADDVGVAGTDDEPVDVLRGVALYERAALAAVGGFDPFLQSMEDIDLSFRLDAAEYDLVRLGDVVASHPPRNAEGERGRRWKNGYYHGRGQLFRKYLTRPRLFARLAYRTRLFLGPLTWLAVAPVATAAAGKRGLAAWTAATVAGLAGVVHRQGTDWTADKFVAAGPVLAGTALGFPGERQVPSDYPLDDVETIQTGPSTAEREPVHAT